MDQTPNYNLMSCMALKKIISQRKLFTPLTYLQRIRKEEAIEMLEAADRGEQVVIPQRLIEEYRKIREQPPRPATEEVVEDESGELDGEALLAEILAGGDDGTQDTKEEVDEEVDIEAELADIFGDAKPEAVDAGEYMPSPEDVEEDDLPYIPVEVTTEEEDDAPAPSEEELAKAKQGQQTLNDIFTTILNSIQQVSDRVETLEAKPGVDTDELEAKFEKVMEKMKGAGGGVQPLVIEQPDIPPVTIKTPHAKFPDLLKLVNAQVNCYLVGPAGSGKTQAAAQVARSLFPGEKGKFGAISLCRQTSKGDLLGYKDVNGVYQESELVRIFTNGGVFLFDEVDQATDSIMKLCNMAIGNGAIATQDGLKQRHPKFYCIAAANTYGTGADRMYCGANQLDASTLNRFCFIEWPYDHELENQMIGVAQPDSQKCPLKNIPSPAQWLHVVRVARANIQKNRMRMVVSPRTSLMGVHAISAGSSLENMLEGFIYQGAAEDKKKVVFDPARDFAA